VSLAGPNGLEYRLQTIESSAWYAEFRAQEAELKASPQRSLLSDPTAPPALATPEQLQDALLSLSSKTFLHQRLFKAHESEKVCVACPSRHRRDRSGRRCDSCR